MEGHEAVRLRALEDRPAGLAGTDPTAASTGGGGGAYLEKFTADAGRFARVGIPSTLAWLALFLGLRPTLGPFTRMSWP